MDRRRVALAVPSCAALAALLVVLLPATAMADRHKAGFGGAGIYTDRSDLWGGAVMGEVKVQEWGKRTDPLHPFMLSLAGDLSVVTGRHEVQDFTQTTGLLGPRLTWNSPFGRHVEPYGQVLLGFAHESAAEGRTSFAGAFALGVDVPLVKDLTVAGHPKVVGRLQFAYHFVNEDSTSWYPQVTLGLMYRINKKN